MPPARGGRPLKRWRYVGIYASEVMLCAGVVRIGVLPQCFWAVWDPGSRRLRERTRFLRSTVRLDEHRCRIHDGDVRIDLALDPGDPIEVVSPHGAQYAWTRKQGGIRARGTVSLGGVERRVDARGVVDESAGYHARETAWKWTAGVGTTGDGSPVAWNLVDGVHDDHEASERTIWLAGEPHELGPVVFAPDLSGLTGHDGSELTFDAQAERRRDDNLLVFRSVYAQPFGTFGGFLPGGIGLAEGYGVMERHDVRW
jgi:Protein of unknown function (DUF2804)